MKKKKLTKFTSFFAIGEEVAYNLNGEDFTNFGSITAVRFTKAKVFYEIVDDYDGKIKKNIDSCDILYPN